MLQVLVYYGLAQSSSIANVGHFGPVVICDWVEGANCLTSGVVFDEGDFSGYVNLGFFFRDIVFFGGHWLWTEPTAIMDYVFSIPEERGMSMQGDLSIFTFIPFCIEKEIFSV